MRHGLADHEEDLPLGVILGLACSQVNARRRDQTMPKGLPFGKVANRGPQSLVKEAQAVLRYRRRNSSRAVVPVSRRSGASRSPRKGGGPSPV